MPFLSNFAEEHLSVLANPDTLASLPTEVVDPLLRSDTSKAQEYLQGLLSAADVGYKTVLRRRPVPLTDGPPDDDYIICFNIGSLKSTRLYIDAVYRKIAELANLLAGSDIPKSPDGWVRLQTLQSYDGRDVPGNFNPTTQNVIATNKFSVLSYGNLRPMSKDVLETLLIIDFKATGKGRRFQYATYGPPAPAEGRTIKEYAVRLAPATQAVGEGPAHLPPSLLHSMELTFARTVCSSLSNDMALTQKPVVGTAMLSNYILCPPVIHRPLQTLLRTHPFVGHRPILSFWLISPAHGAHIRGHWQLTVCLAPTSPQFLHLTSTPPGRILPNLCGLILNAMVPPPLLYCPPTSPTYLQLGTTISMFKPMVALLHTSAKRPLLILWRKMPNQTKSWPEMTSLTHTIPPLPFKSCSQWLTPPQRSFLTSSPPSTTQLWLNSLSPTLGHD